LRFTFYIPPVRIGLFTNNYLPLINGLAASVERVALGLRRAGHDVTVVAPHYGGEADAAGCLRVPGVRVPTHHAYVLPVSWWPGVARAVAGLRLDVYHAHHPFLLGAAAAVWARRAGKPLVFTWHTHYERYGHYGIPGLAGPAGRLALRRALAFADRTDLVIAPAPGVATLLSRRGVRAPIAVVPTGVPLQPPTEPAARRRAREELGLPPASPLCLSVGRLAAEKNQAFLLRAFARILADLPQALLLLAGDGDDRGRLERLAADLDAGSRVRFAGAVPPEAVFTYYRAADLFLFPSTSETQGLVIAEALAAGLPVVAVRSQAAADLLVDDDAGVLTPEESAAFARAAVELWRTPGRLRDLTRRGRRVAARYSPERCAARLLVGYERAEAWRAGAGVVPAREAG
jgi:glycosyltransferase involved in cell wall biosynthesis